MKTTLLMLLFAILAMPGSAQNILLKDGKLIGTKSLRREGDTIMATIDLPGTEPGQPARTGELGYPLSQISRLEFPEPAQLRTAPDLIVQGMAAEALAQLEPVVKYYEGFRDAPGSWWAQAAILKVQTLISVGQDKEAEPLAEKVLHLGTDPETLRAAQVQIAAGLVRKGGSDKALEICNAALKESKEPRTLAAAYIVKGQCLLAAKQWEDAILSFLEIPVFYPAEKLLLPASLLGVGRAHFGMDNLPDARTALNDLIKTHAGSSEAAKAKTELEKIARREKALANPQ